MSQFTECSVNHLLAQFSPVPNHNKLEDKFEYFYRPYNYACNTSKFISYEFALANPFKAYVDLANEESFIEEYFKSLGMSSMLKG
jgi:hypothetical protein